MATKHKHVEWAPQYFRSVTCAERAAQRIADVFRARVVVREKWIDSEDRRGLYGVWKEDTEATAEEEAWFLANHWVVLFVEDARPYDEDGKLKSDKEKD